MLFYSRRIGFDNDRAVPIRAGGRLTGRVGPYSIGVLNIQSGRGPVSDARPTNFSVARLKRDVLRKSTVGALFAGRSVSRSATGRTKPTAWTGPSRFSTTSPSTRIGRRRAPTIVRGTTSAIAASSTTPAIVTGSQLEHLAVGANFNPEVGFIRRRDVRRSFGQFRFSPRPKANTRIRRYFSMGSLSYIENAAGRVEARNVDTELAIEFQNQDRLSVGWSTGYEFLPQVFTIVPGIDLPVGGYDFSTLRAGFNLGPARRVAGNVSVEQGRFYDGDKTTVAWSRGRVNVTPQLSVEPRISVDRVSLIQGSFTSRLVGARVTSTMTPLMFVSALVQYNSTSNLLAANVRFRWEYHPGSELFVVFNEQRDTRRSGFPDLANRAFIVKVNRLFRF